MFLLSYGRAILGMVAVLLVLQKLGCTPSTEAAAPSKTEVRYSPVALAVPQDRGPTLRYACEVEYRSRWRSETQKLRIVDAQLEARQTPDKWLTLVGPELTIWARSGRLDDVGGKGVRTTLTGDDLGTATAWKIHMTHWTRNDNTSYESTMRLDFTTGVLEGEAVDSVGDGPLKRIELTGSIKGQCRPAAAAA